MFKLSFIYIGSFCLFIIVVLIIATSVTVGKLQRNLKISTIVIASCVILFTIGSSILLHNSFGLGPVIIVFIVILGVMLIVLLSSNLVEMYSNGNDVLISNPLSAEMKYLRNSIIPGLVSAAEYNINHQNQYFKIFES